MNINRKCSICGDFGQLFNGICLTCIESPFLNDYNKNFIKHHDIQHPSKFQQEKIKEVVMKLNHKTLPNGLTEDETMFLEKNPKTLNENQLRKWNFLQDKKHHAQYRVINNGSNVTDIAKGLTSFYPIIEWINKIRPDFFHLNDGIRSDMSPDITGIYIDYYVRVKLSDKMKIEFFDQRTDDFTHE